MLFSTLFDKYVSDVVNPKTKHNFISPDASKISATADITAMNGDYLVIDTRGQEIPGSGLIITLPATPTAKGTIYFYDLGRNLASVPAIITGNGSRIQGKSEDFVLDVNGVSIALTYIDANIGYEITGNADATSGPTLVSPDGTMFVLEVSDAGVVSGVELSV